MGPNKFLYFTIELDTHFFAGTCSRNQMCSYLGGKGTQVSPEFADQLTLFKPGRADYAQHITASPPGFKKISTPLETVTHTFQEAPKN